MQAKLTQQVARAAQPGARDINITDSSLPGFELRIRPSGAKTWVFRYRLNGGRQQRLRLGGFPGLPAEQARKLALAAAADVAKGIDVQSRKSEAKVEAARQRASTLSGLPRRAIPAVGGTASPDLEVSAQAHSVGFYGLARQTAGGYRYDIDREVARRKTRSWQPSGHHQQESAATPCGDV